MSVIEIRNISHRFSSKSPDVLVNISANLPQGKMIGLVGPDGAGKTTLMRMMAALLLPTEGEILIQGHDCSKGSEAIHTLCGYMPQRFGLYEELSVMENLQLYANLRNVPVPQQEGAFASLLELTQLKPFVDRRASALSGGMKQKLGLACALIKQPPILLLDEPSVGVDPLSRKDLWQMVKSLTATIVWSTAYLDEAMQCDFVLLLNEGKVQFLGSPQELTNEAKGLVFKIEHPANKRACLKSLLQDKNVINAGIEGDSIRLTVANPERLPTPECKSVAPLFEDAFIRRLGGMQGKESLFSQIFPKVESKETCAIDAKDLTKKFGSFTAVDHVSFQVKQGEIFGLLGPNGAGKSTTFKMLCGLTTPTEGSASIYGIDLQKDPSRARAHVGYMAQKFSLYGTLTVSQNLSFFSSVYGVGKSLQNMIDLFNLSPYLHTQADLLPLGLKQRLSLAIATLHLPKILFLDEPTSGMDPIARREFWMHANALAEQGCTILVSTHFMEEAENCDRIALIYQGKLIYLDEPDALKNKAQSDTLEDAFIHLIREYDAHHPE